LDILLIEDNKVYAKAVTQVLQKHLLFADIKSISSFKELLDKNLDKFSLFIVDYNLPDTKADEHIKYLLDKDKKIIILTANFNDEVRKKYIEKVIDYVYKEDNSTIYYLLNLIKRYQKNEGKSVLLVDDSSFERKRIAKYLELLNLNVYEAENGKDALKIIENKEIFMLLTDLSMAVMDGSELIKKVRIKKSLGELPIIAFSGVEGKYETIKVIKRGANDFIRKPFEKEELIARVNNLLTMYDYLHKYKESSIIDSLTKMYNREFLQTKVEGLFNIYEKKCIAMLDIDFFKKINDTKGHLFGDKVLRCFAKIIKAEIRKSDIIVRYGGEEFLIFMPNTSKEEALIIILKIKKALKLVDGYKFTFSAGIADEGDTLVEMIKIADNRLYKAKKAGRDHIIFK